MANIEHIKRKIQQLYTTNPNIHISVNLERPKLIVDTAPAVIKGVYPNIFRIEEYTHHYPRRHAIQYTAVLLGHVRIAELGQLSQEK